MTLPQWPVGQTFSARIQTQADQARRYAEASGDFNPIHLDDAFAKKMGLKGPSLHGLLTMGLLTQEVMRVIQDANLIRRIKLRFAQPVYPGETLTVTFKITESSAEKVRMQVAATNSAGADIVSGVQIDL